MTFINLQGLEPYQCFIYGVLSSLAVSQESICMANNDLYAALKHSALPCIVALKKLAKLGLIEVNFNSETTFILMRQQHSEVA